MATPGDTARLTHHLTSYSLGDDWPRVPPDHPLVLRDFAPLDRPTFPAPCKAYAQELPTVALPREWPAGARSATAVLAGHAGEPAELDLAALARLLHLSAGVVRTTERPDGRRYLFRAAGSAGGRFPLELYVSARGVGGLPDGVHWYDPVGHALRQVGPPADGDATAVVVTGVPWRTAWQYAERGFRHIYWDGGTMLAQLLAVADDSGLQPRLFTRFPDAEVTRLAGADGTHEFAIAAVALGAGEPALRPTGEAAAGAVDRAPVEFPLMTHAQRAGDTAALGAPWPAPPRLDAGPPPSAGLEEVILRRGSTRLMDATRTLPRATLTFSLAASLRGVRAPHFVAVHGVDDTEPGLYRWPDLDDPRRCGDLREELFRVCWEQELGRDAAFVVIGATDLDALEDDRAYRERQLEAGIVEGRLHLAAYALGAGATGMTFLDSEIDGLLGEPLAALLFTCVGVPTYRSRRGGRPGAPIAVA
ncbi:MAG TPA: hypothetical protein VFG79_20390 [Solirubrobacter sp.]|nr:hypothetical protein [Solirubrobacter sp.]